MLGVMTPRRRQPAGEMGKEACPHACMLGLMNHIHGCLREAENLGLRDNIDEDKSYNS